jgi:hypothetical protein
MYWPFDSTCATEHITSQLNNLEGMEKWVLCHRHTMHASTPLGMTLTTGTPFLVRRIRILFIEVYSGSGVMSAIAVETFKRELPPFSMVEGRRIENHVWR